MLLAMFFEHLPRQLDTGRDVLEYRLRTGTLSIQEHPEGLGKDDLVFENGALDLIHHLHHQKRQAAVARASQKETAYFFCSVVPLRASRRASRPVRRSWRRSARPVRTFLTPLSASRAPFLTPLRTRLRRLGGRRGGRGAGLASSGRYDQNRRRGYKPKRSRISKKSESVSTINGFRFRAFIHRWLPLLLPRVLVV